MKYTNYIWGFFALAIVAISITSCEKDEPLPVPFFDRNSGVYFTQEGQFMTGTAALGFYNYNKDSLTLDAYADVNMEPLGDILQGALINEKEFYLLVNGSGKIVEVKVEGPEKERVIGGVKAPNAMIKSGPDEAIITDSFGPYVYKLNLRTGLLIDSVDVGGGSGESFVDDLGNVYIAKSSDFGADPSQMVLVVDLNSFELIDTIMVGFNPMAIVDDVDGYLWVHCNGNSFEGRTGGLYRFDPDRVDQDSILDVRAFPFPDMETSFFSRMVTNATKTQIYYLKGGVYSVGYRDTILPTEPIIANNGQSFYGLGLRPDNNDIYIGVENFVGESKVRIFNNTGTEVKSFDSRVGVNHFYF